MRKEQKANYPESARGAAALLVRMVLEDGAYTNIALNQYLRGSSLSDLDRRLATELVYGTVKASGTRSSIFWTCHYFTNFGGSWL